VHPPERRMVEPHVSSRFSEETVFVMDDLDEDGKRKAWKTED
jgi:hypothetical protein